MKKSVLNGFVAALLVTSLGLAGCHQTKKTESKTPTSSKVVKKTKKTKTSTSRTQSSTTSVTTTTQTQSTTTTTTSTPTPQPTILNQLVGKHFIFTSGHGGWSTYLEMGENGTFKGKYHDSEMGVTGPGYPGGTMEYCEFTAQFTNPVQINDFTYRLTISNLQYTNPAGTSEIKNETKYNYTDAHGIYKNQTMDLYLPGAPRDQLPQTYYVLTMDQIPKDSPTLPQFGLFGETSGGAFVETD